LISILPILILVALLTPFFFRQGAPVWQIRGTVLVTIRGLEETGRLLIRFTGITTVFALFYLTTPAEQFLSALEWYGLPFRAALVLNLTLRFIPSLFILYQRVEDAHSLRRAGELSGHSGFFRRFRNLLPTLTSVLIQAIKKIGPLSMTLELQGVGLPGPRTRFFRLPRFRDVALQFFFTFLGLGFLVAVLVIFPQLWYNGAS
jgi:energy-coupling factor transport system permease protein